MIIKDVLEPYINYLVYGGVHPCCYGVTYSLWFPNGWNITILGFNNVNPKHWDITLIKSTANSTEKYVFKPQLKLSKVEKLLENVFSIEEHNDLNFNKV